MTLSAGRDLFMTPGPSVMPDRVLNAMHRAAPNIYEGPLIAMTDSIKADLQTIVGTKGHAIIYICNGHGTWEAAINNCIAPGSKTLHLVTGSFGTGWAATAEKAGILAEVMDFGCTDGLDCEAVTKRLQDDSAHEIKSVMVTHTDTSSGLRNNIPSLRAAIDAAGHPALLMADCVASIGCERFEMDAWGVDVAISVSQKGLMTPPGLGYVFFNDKAEKISRNIPKSSSYWDWIPRAYPDLFYHQFNGTAPTHHLFGQRAALDMLMAEGHENTWQRHSIFANAIWSAVEAWGSTGPIQLSVPNRKNRSRAVTTVLTGKIDCGPLRAWCEEKAGLTLGLLIGFEEGINGFRIGHMGHLNPPMVLGALATVDAGLKALKIPHGNGALAAASQAIAKASASGAD